MTYDTSSVDLPHAAICSLLHVQAPRNQWEAARHFPRCGMHQALRFFPFPVGNQCSYAGKKESSETDKNWVLSEYLQSAPNQVGR